jgi:signal peptidase I
VGYEKIYEFLKVSKKIYIESYQSDRYSIFYFLQMVAGYRVSLGRPFSEKVYNRVDGQIIIRENFNRFWRRLMQTAQQDQNEIKTPSSRSIVKKLISLFLFAWGIISGIAVIWFGYIFIRTQMINLVNIAIIAIGVSTSTLLVITAFRVSKQKWFVTLITVGLLILVGTFFTSPLLNYSTARLQMLSISMEPTLSPNDYFIVDRLAYQSESPQRGDLIIFEMPYSGPGIKRVIGLPGETVKIDSGQVYINGQVLNEPEYISKTRYQGQWLVGESEYFVLGDNRNNSSDSHNWGNVPQQNIYGKLTYIYLPLSRSGKITNNYLSP